MTAPAENANSLAQPAAAETPGALSFHEVVRRRYSCRAFLPQPVPQPLMQQVLEEAQMAPSNCNTQPWSVHIVSGQKQKELSDKLVAAHEAGHFSLDFTFDTNDFAGRYKERQFAQGKTYYEALRVARENKVARRDVNLYNHLFYHAPHVAFLFMPAVGDNVRVASDVGMYAQNFLLALTAHGLGGVPQTVLGMYADVIREHLGIPADLKLLFGISFGYPDEKAPVNGFKMGRDPVTASVTFY